MVKKLLLLLAISINLFALETNLTGRKVLIDSKGVEKFESAQKLSPGEVIEYEFSIKNLEPTSEYGLYPSIPIPNEMVLVADQVYPSVFEVSVDGENYVSYPVYDTEGKQVDPSAYKKVRWFIEEIKPNEEKLVKLRAVLNE